MRKLVLVAGLVVLTLASCTKKAADEDAPTPTATPEPTTQPQPVTLTQAEPAPSPWERVCSNPIVRIQPAIQRTGLKIADGYVRSREHINDGTGPWGSLSFLKTLSAREM